MAKLELLVSKGWLKAVEHNAHSVIKQAGMKDLVAKLELNKVDRDLNQQPNSM